jgi:hypothetical protein
MINWAKFSNPYSSESAHLSDRIYPLSHDIVRNCVDSIDHTQCLMQSDMLHNAEDRRFALAQSSPSRKAYNFRTNKVEQIAGAIDTLSNYLNNHRSTNRDSPPSGLMDIKSLTNDLAGTGTVTTDLDTDLASECHLSPLPTVQQPGHSNRTLSRPVSPRQSAHRRTLPSATRRPSVEALAATAPTTTTRLSIADLIHPPDCSGSPFRPRRTFSPLLTPDPTALDSIEAFHLPDSDYLRQTLDSIRSTRHIYSHQLSSPRRSPQTISGGHSQNVARSLRLCRMRRSSKPRDHKSKRSSMADPTSLRVHQNDVGPMMADTLAPEGTHEASQPPARSFHLTSANLDQWWAAETTRHARYHSESPELNTPRLHTCPRTIIDPIIEVDPTVDAGHSAVDERDESTIYAYTRPQEENTVDTTYRYGYIAGDVPRGERSRARIRGRTRGRRSRVGVKTHLEMEAKRHLDLDVDETGRKIHDHDEEGTSVRLNGKRKRECTNALDSTGRSGFEASRDDKLTAPAPYSEPALARTYNGPRRLHLGAGLSLDALKGESRTEDLEDEPGLDEEELAQLREARARAKKWWNEPLWPSTCLQEG